MPHLAPVPGSVRTRQSARPRVPPAENWASPSPGCRNESPCTDRGRLGTAVAPRPRDSHPCPHHLRGRGTLRICPHRVFSPAERPPHSCRDSTRPWSCRAAAAAGEKITPTTTSSLTGLQKMIGFEYISRTPPAAEASLICDTIVTFANAYEPTSPWSDPLGLLA